MTTPVGETYMGDGQGHVAMSIGELHMLAKHTVMDKVDEMLDALDAIGKALEGLQISWAGEAKNEAQQLIDRWTQVSTALFGTKENPEIGVLSRIAGGVRTAAFTYNKTETTVQESWQKLRGDLQTILDGGTPTGEGSSKNTAPISQV
ncbi:hypothetical protein [Actinoplanes sp. NPDC048796]|uniref:WXG100 family type VII secretion target n=1 Tax=unclassified Actinoplanes TaxID=2626549 RepID=UPI0033D3C970